MSKIVLGVMLIQRRETATNVQEVFTQYGCFIKSRIGLHQGSDTLKECSEKGLIILELMDGTGNEAFELEEKLKAISGVTVKKMEF